MNPYEDFFNTMKSTGDYLQQKNEEKKEKTNKLVDSLFQDAREGNDEAQRRLEETRRRILERRRNQNLKENTMDDFRNLMYDLIIESLVDKLENYEITMEDAEIFSEAVYDELFYEGNNLERDLKRYKMKKALKGIGEYANLTARSAATGAAAGAVGGAVGFGPKGVKRGALYGAGAGAAAGLLGSAVNAVEDGFDKIRDINISKNMLKNKTTKELQSIKKVTLELLNGLTKKYKNSDSRSHDEELHRIDELRQALKYIDAELDKRK